MNLTRTQSNAVAVWLISRTPRRLASRWNVALITFWISVDRSLTSPPRAGEIVFCIKADHRDPRRCWINADMVLVWQMAKNKKQGNRYIIKTDLEKNWQSEWRVSVWSRESHVFSAALTAGEQMVAQTRWKLNRSVAVVFSTPRPV